MHQVAVLALDNLVPLDFGIACDIFERVAAADGTKAYDVRICSQARTVKTRGFSMRIPYGLEALATADTIVVPGIEDTMIPISKPIVAALQNARDRGARVTSICTGAFVLAASGVLDGRRATTHWMLAAKLAERFPAVSVQPDVLFVDEGQIVTSAGASAGIDMCLHLVRQDHGQAIAARAARLAVAPLSRDGGQSQFIDHAPPKEPCSLAPLLDWMMVNVAQSHSVDTLADMAGMTPRTFARRFRDQTGTTPLQWLVAARVQRAQQILQESLVPIDNVATMAGFDSPVTFRARFRRIVGLTPTEYRRRFCGPR